MNVEAPAPIRTRIEAQVTQRGIMVTAGLLDVRPDTLRRLRLGEKVRALTVIHVGRVLDQLEQTAA